MEESPTSQYDFILNADKKPAAPSGSKKTRRLLIIIAVLVVATIGALLYSFSAGPSTPSSEGLAGIAQKQTEILRIAEIGQKKATSPDTKTFIATVSYSLTTAQQQSTAMLKKSSTKVNLAGGKDPLVDTRLNTASLNNTFDQTFNEVMQAQLTDYQTALKSAVAGAKSTKEKDLLNAELKQIGIILHKN